MNKKYLMFGMMGLFVMAIATAAVVNYYGSVSQEIIIDSPLDISELESMTLEGYLQSPQYGGEVTVENKADFDVDVEVSSVAMEGEDISEDIKTNYVGTLELTTKNIDTWAATETAKATITYTVVGDKFVVSGVPEGYTLVYYPNTEEGWSNDIINTIVLNEGVNDIPSLPINIDVGDDYCTNGKNPFAIVCDGAKLWLIPGDDGVINWNNADTYLFETDLINYFKTEAGVITIPAGVSMDFTPMYEFGVIKGTYNIATSVTPVTA